jgi:hypothetical protein
MALAGIVGLFTICPALGMPLTNTFGNK